MSRAIYRASYPRESDYATREEYEAAVESFEGALACAEIEDDDKRGED